VVGRVSLGCSAWDCYLAAVRLLLEVMGRDTFMIAGRSGLSWSACDLFAKFDWSWQYQCVALRSSTSPPISQLVAGIGARARRDRSATFLNRRARCLPRPPGVFTLEKPIIDRHQKGTRRERSGKRGGRTEGGKRWKRKGRSMKGRGERVARKL